MGGAPCRAAPRTAYAERGAEPSRFRLRKRKRRPITRKFAFLLRFRWIFAPSRNPQSPPSRAFPSFPRRRESRPHNRHSGVGRNPVGRANAPSPLTPTRPVIPAKAGTYPLSPRLQAETEALVTPAPCAATPLIHYYGSRCTGDAGGKADEAGKGALHSAPFLHQTAPKQLHRRPKANQALGVNGAKWCSPIAKARPDDPNPGGPYRGRAGSAPSPLLSTSHVIPAKAGTYPLAAIPAEAPRPMRPNP